MNKWLINKKLVAISAVVLAILISAAVFGAPLAASYYYKKGAQAYLQNNFSAAKRNLNTSLTFDSKNYRAYFLLGKIALGPPAPKTDNYYPQADYKEAARYYEKASSLGLEQKNLNLYKVALDDLGNAYWKLNELDKTREKYSEKLSKFPDSSFWARYFIASDDFNRLNKPEEALQVLLPALNMAESDNDRYNLFKVYSLLAFLYSYSADSVNVEKYAKLTIGSSQTKNWEVATARSLLAAVYGFKKDFISAEKEIKKANDLSGSVGAYDCFLGAAYAVGKNYSKAVSTALNVAKTGDDNTEAVCLRVLAVSYSARGDKVKAKKYMEEYLSFTAKFAQKNIFVARNRKEFTGELQKLK